MERDTALPRSTAGSLYAITRLTGTESSLACELALEFVRRYTKA